MVVLLAGCDCDMRLVPGPGLPGGRVRHLPQDAPREDEEAPSHSECTGTDSSPFFI